MAHILLVDDDEPLRRLLRRTLNRLGHRVTEATNGEEAWNAFHQTGADLIIMDLIMPEKEGFETIRLFRKNRSTVKIIAMTGGGRVEPQDLLQTALMLGANAMLSKPFSQETLASTIDRLLSPQPAADEKVSPPNAGA